MSTNTAHKECSADSKLDNLPPPSRDVANSRRADQPFGSAYLWWALSISAALCILLYLVLPAAPAPKVLSARTAFSLQDSFQRRATSQFFHGAEQDIRSRVDGIAFFDSLGFGAGETGILLSPPFTAPSILSLYISGYPLSAGIHLELLDEETGTSLPLGAPNSYTSWTQVFWSLPEAFVGRRVRLRVVDTDASPNQWIGVSTPLSSSSEAPWLVDKDLLLLAPSILMQYFLLFVPGMLILYFTGGATKFPAWFRLPAALVVSTTLSYGIFWLYFLHPDLGRSASITSAAVSLLAILKVSAQPRFRRLVLTTDCLTPALLHCAVALLYIAAAFLVPLGDSPDVNLQHRFLILPGDNLIPRYFAEKLFLGLDPRPIMGDWLSSDRPPLQTALLLLVRPFINFGDDRMLNIQYLIGAVLSQALWVPAVWSLGRFLRLSVYQRSVIFCCLLFSGTFFLHSVYVWPKFLAGALGVFATILLLQLFTNRRATTTLRASTAALGLGLAFLSHGGVIFFYPPLFAILLLPRYFPGMKQVVTAVCLMAALIAPWMAYQKYYEPPANRLVKWHLAGMIDINELSTGEAVLHAYSSAPATEILTNKALNLWWMFGRPFFKDPGLRRTNEFYFTTSALSVLNIGFIAWLCATFLRPVTSRDHRRMRLCWWLLFWGVISWSLILFGPRGDVIHVGSFIHFILLYFVAALGLTYLPKPLGILLGVLYAGLFLAAWVHPATVIAHHQYSLLTQPLPLTICAFTLLAMVLGFYLYRTPPQIERP